ncbi:MAG TPA: DUF2924 domain-containing protein [Dehalococcoidia bacterium]|nr:DUF2924 domain-containing protein [Dehalococcoidia bacterium]
MAVENRNLLAGTRLTATYKKQTYVCTIEAAEGGDGIVFVYDGKSYKSPSAAGSAVMGGTACNGWRFWSLEGEEPKAAAAPNTPKATPADKTSKPRTRKAPKATKLIYRMDDQAGATEGMTRWWCSACMDAFEVFGAEKPTQCPEGHRIDDAELTAPAGVTVEAEAEVTA